MALVLVLWVLAILALLALSLAYSVRVSVRSTANAALSAEAYFAAYSGLERAIIEREADVNGYDAEDETWVYLNSEDEELLPGEASFVVSLSDECGKLNLNTATAEQLLALGVMDEEIVDCIIDWRDEDDEASPNGAEEEYYQELNPPYHCANRPFRSIEELLLVKGVDALMLYGEAEQEERLSPAQEALAQEYGTTLPQAEETPPLIELLTVTSRARELASDGELRLDATQASQQHLQERLVADLDSSDIQAIANYLENNRSITSISSLWNVPGMTREKMMVVVDKLSVRGEEGEAAPGGGEGGPGAEPSEPPTGPAPPTPPGGGGPSIPSGPSGPGGGAGAPPPRPTAWQGYLGTFFFAQLTPPAAPAAPTAPGAGAPGAGAPEAGAPEGEEEEPTEEQGPPPLMEEPVEGLININTAPAEVLLCLPGMTEEAAAALVRRRGEAPFESRGSLLASDLEEEISRGLFDSIVDLITVNSDTYRVSSLGQVGETGIVSHVTVILDMAGDEPRLAYVRQDN